MGSLWSRLSWPQVVALGLVVAGVVTVLVAVPGEKLELIPWEQVVGLVAVLVGGGVGALSGPLLRPSTAPPAPAPRPPRTGREGFADPEALAWIVLWALATTVAFARFVAPVLVVALVLSGSGCGAGALQAHARASSWLITGIEVADAIADTGAEVAIEGCETPDCIAHVEEATVAIDAGIASARVPLLGYVEGVRLALAGGEDVDVLLGLAGVLARCLEAWNELAPLFAPLGLELPPIPESLVRLVAAFAPPASGDGT